MRLIAQGCAANQCRNEILPLTARRPEPWRLLLTRQLTTHPSRPQRSHALDAVHSMILLRNFPLFPRIRNATTSSRQRLYLRHAFVRPYGHGRTRRGETGAVYEFVSPLEGDTDGTRGKNMWVVRRTGKHELEFVAKGPSRGDDKTRGWPGFQHELKMQRLFNNDKMIRPMVDFIPSSDEDEPMMILKPFEQTLWDDRRARPMTTAEIKWIMEGVLLGVQTIHRRGLVHTGLCETSLQKFARYIADIPRL